MTLYQVPEEAVEAGIAAQRAAVTKYTRAPGENDARIENLTMRDALEAAAPYIIATIQRTPTARDRSGE